MTRGVALVLVLGAAVALAFQGTAQADVYKRGAGVRGAEGTTVSTRKSGPRVRAYIAGRGGYSLTPADAVSPYGPYYNRYYYNGPYVFSRPRQTEFGPFDSGFFFDSGIEPRGGYSPYLN